MRYPKDWIRSEEKVLLGNLSNIEMTDQQVGEFLKGMNGSVLLFAFTKYVPNRRAGINPTIQARAISNGTGRVLAFSEFKPAIIAAFKSQQKLFADYEFLVEPSETEVAGIPAVHSVSKYTLIAQGGAKYKVRSHNYAIPYRTYFIKLSFVDEVDVQDCSEEFSELVRSIRIGK